MSARRGAAAAAAGSPYRLPAPRLGRGTSLERALRQRRTTREIGARPVSPQLLSNLLWAACGVNRHPGPFGYPGITAASASNSQEIELYVALERGVYRFEAHRHRLVAVAAEDLRPLCIGRGQRAMLGEAPVQLVYVVDVRRLTHTAGFREPGLQEPETQKAYYYADTGMIAANVYLFAASRGLAAWFHNCDRAALAKALPLRREQRVLFAQSVGYPAQGG